MANMIETTDAAHSLRTISAYTEAENRMVGEEEGDVRETYSHSVAWDDGSAVIEVEGSRADLMAFFAKGLDLASGLPE
jgi:hypothetical protein